MKKLFKSKDDFLDFSYSLEELEDLKDIWAETAKSILEYFQNKAHKEILAEMMEILNLEFYKQEEKTFDENSFFAGKKVCITGSFEKNWEKISRDKLVEILEKNGWEFVSSVSKNTDFLLAWEKAWSKLEKAKSLSVEIIWLDEFFEKIGEE